MFSKNEPNNLDIKEGKYDDPTEKVPKFETEARICFGAGLIEKNGQLEAWKAKPFCYTAKNVISLKKLLNYKKYK